MNKYHNRKIIKDGMTFDSVKEYRRFCELLLLEKAGAITGLECQTPFELIPTQRINGKVVERACTYKADFTYYLPDKTWVVEDTKGYKTPEYKIKKKLMLRVFGIQIKET